MNSARGEIKVSLADQEFVLTPSFTAMVEFEDKVGQTAMEVLNGIGDQKISVKAIVTAIWAGIVGTVGKKAPSWDWVGGHIQEQGIISFVPVAVQFLSVGVTGKLPDELSQEEGQGNE